MANYKSYVWCFVPGCTNTSHTTPNKIFINVPKGEKRIVWCKAVGLRKILSLKTPHRCCEDHFNIQEDAENWIHYKLLCNTDLEPTLKLKSGVLPHIFLNRPDEDISQTHKICLNTETEVSRVTKQSQIKKQADSCPSNCNMTEIPASRNSFAKDDIHISASAEKSGSCQEAQLPLPKLSALMTDSDLNIGINCKQIGAISVLEEFTGCSKIDILLSLYKIRRNQSFKDIGSIFDLEQSNISASIFKTIPLISHFLSTLIFCPEFDDSNLGNSPISFPVDYTSVQAVLECFEVMIDRPTNPDEQILMWSSSKAQFTVKFLISVTPDGFITFVSKGFGGSTSDTEIVESSGFLDQLKPGSKIMVNRGFGQIETLLTEKDCFAVRVPISDKSQNSKSLNDIRFIVAAVLTRISEYALFSFPSFESSLLDLVDYCIIIACALANMQGPPIIR